MATTTITRRHGVTRGRWLVAGIGLIVLMIGAALFLSGIPGRRSAALVTGVPVTHGAIIANVAGSGTVAPVQTLDLAFQASGTVTQVLASEGDLITTGQVLARLDDRLLQIQVANAQAGLTSAQARLAQAKSGNSKPEDIDAAKAALASAQANYKKVATGASAADYASARAAVTSAQAAYNAAVKAAGSSSSQLTSAKAALDKAQASLQQAQANYDRVAWAPDIGMRPESLALQNATFDYQQAKANYDALANTSGTDNKSKIDSAAAQLAQAKANLANLGVKNSDLSAAQANVDQAQANLEKLTAPATETDLTIQQASVDQAQQALKQAQINLENATLRAPFAGIVTAVNIVPGSIATTATPAVSLIDRDTLHVDLKLSENDVVKVQLNQPVTLTIDSLPNWKVQGKVTYIAPAAQTANGVVTYAIRVSFPDDDPQVKVGMTANVNITTAEKDNVLLVPNTALLPKGARHVVQVVSEEGRTVTEVDVQTGLSDGTQTEIISGLNEGDLIVALPNTGAPRAPGLFGGGNR